MYRKLLITPLIALELGALDHGRAKEIVFAGGNHGMDWIGLRLTEADLPPIVIDFDCGAPPPSIAALHRESLASVLSLVMPAVAPSAEPKTRAAHPMSGALTRNDLRIKARATALSAIPKGVMRYGSKRLKTTQRG